MKAVLLVVVVLIVAGGCIGGGGEKQILEWATPDMAFDIVYPSDGQTVGERVIEVAGVGLPRGSYGFCVSVHTDRWYDQPGDLHRSSNGSWKTTVCLGGTGRYNNHTIEVAATLPDGRRVTARVGNVAAR